jgi:hypothetical protein
MADAVMKGVVMIEGEYLASLQGDGACRWYAQIVRAIAAKRGIIDRRRQDLLAAPYTPLWHVLCRR